MLLEKLNNNIWIYNGPSVSFYGMPFPTRMTVIRLNNGKLWVHSPEKMSTELCKEVDQLGEVGYLISPNLLHHLFVPEWVEAYPDAINYATKGLINKRKDIAFGKVLTDDADEDWQQEIAQVIFKGSFVMEEAVFFHRSSKTIILTDLIENFTPETLSWWHRGLAHFAGILAPNGKAPIDYRATFVLGKKQARLSWAVMQSWDVDNIILSHGECVFGEGTAFLEKSFAWV